MALILNQKQSELFDLIASDATYILAVGGSRSGKTAGIVHAIERRALTIPNSRHGIFRSTAAACRQTIFALTYPDMSRLHKPGLLAGCKVNIGEMTIEYPNGSIVTFGGLDDDARMEKILGDEFITLYVNEVSQIGSFKPIGLLMTRLSQMRLTGQGLPARPKFFFDCNPPSSKHWAYKAFVEKVQPETGVAWKTPDDWASIQMNPIDNKHNLTSAYLDSLENLSFRDQKRFIDGQWQTEVDGALFSLDWVDAARVGLLKGDLVRIVVAVDPATSNHAGSDETGIIVAGIDEEGHGYVLADRSVRGTPETWAKAVRAAYEDFEADQVIYESNQGGLMVETTLRSAGVNLPMKAVHATRGKVLRAEPISTLYEKGRVSHVGEFKELEDQMASFTHTFNRAKQGSPDRLDALVWALTALMTGKASQPSAMEVGHVGGFY